MKTCPSFPQPEAIDYINQIRRMSPFCKYFQLDFADGILVDSKTASLEDFVTTLKNQDLDQFSGIEFDFHFMIRDVGTAVKKLEEIKEIIAIRNVLVHLKAVNNFLFDVMNFSPFTIGITLNPEDTVVELTNTFDLINLPVIQIMSVVPGAQGRPFIPDSLNKIEQLRLLNYRKEILLDGGVNDTTLPIINSLKFKPDVICPGSFLTKCPDEKLKERFEYLLKFA